MSLPAHLPADLLIIVLTQNPPAPPYGLVPSCKVPSPFPKLAPLSSAHLSASKRGIWDLPRTGSNPLSYVLASYCCCNKCLQISWLKTTQLITLQYWRSEVLKAMCRHGCVPSEGSREESSSLGCLCSLARDPFLPSSKPAKRHPQISLFRPSSSIPPLPPASSDSDPFASSFKDSRDYTGPPWMFQDTLPISDPELNHTCKVPLKPEKQHGHWFQRSGCEQLGVVISPVPTYVLTFPRLTSS